MGIGFEFHFPKVIIHEAVELHKKKNRAVKGHV